MGLALVGTAANQKSAMRKSASFSVWVFIGTYFDANFKKAYGLSLLDFKG